MVMARRMGRRRRVASLALMAARMGYSRGE